MSFLIPREIAEDEILVHFIFDRNFKKKKITKEELVSKDIFLPNKGGVSLQRNNYCPENKCKEFAKQIASRNNYIGFIIFRKKTFEDVKERYVLNDREDFNAKIIATPLDDTFKTLPNDSEIFVDTPGNPAHADLIYENPAPKDNESPNTAIRSFSRKLSKDCKLIIDKNPLSNTYDEVLFRDVV